MSSHHFSEKPGQSHNLSQLLSCLDPKRRAFTLQYLRGDSSVKTALYKEGRAFLEWLEQGLWEQANADQATYYSLWEELHSQLELEEKDKDLAKTQHNKAANKPAVKQEETLEAFVAGLSDEQRHRLKLVLERKVAEDAEVEFLVGRIGGFTAETRDGLKKVLGLRPTMLPSKLTNKSLGIKPPSYLSQSTPFSQSQPSVCKESPWTDLRPQGDHATRVRKAFEKNSLEQRLFDYIQGLAASEWRTFQLSFSLDRGAMAEASNIDVNQLIRIAQEGKRLQAEWGCSAEQIKTALTRLTKSFRAGLEVAPAGPTLSEKPRGFLSRLFRKKD